MFVLDKELYFPPISKNSELVAIGGDLSQERLILAYSQGIFPWYEEDSEILWWSPLKRAIISPYNIHRSRSLKRLLNKGLFTVKFDSEFENVIKACASVKRIGQHGTWIVQEMQEAYLQLHQSGYAHSVEVYLNDRLVGGLYGVSMGSMFCGESMFSLEPNASKVAFIALGETLTYLGYNWIDCQMMNDYLRSFGVYEIPRETYLQYLAQSMEKVPLSQDWNQTFYKNNDIHL